MEKTGDRKLNNLIQVFQIFRYGIQPGRIGGDAQIDALIKAGLADEWRLRYIKSEGVLFCQGAVRNGLVQDPVIGIVLKDNDIINQI